MIIITSASRGIGKFLFLHFKQIGVDVIGFYNNTVPDNLDGYFKVDVTNPAEIKDFFAEYADRLSSIILINTAGISYNAFAHKSNAEMWKEVIDVNVIGLFNVVKMVLPVMRDNNYGRIINLSSVVAQKGVPGTSAYAASKSAVWGLSKALVAENASKAITINNINLGYFNIGMIEQVPAEHLAALIQSIPAKRLGTAEEILSTINFIIDNSYLNGASIDLNGGLV